MRDIVYLDLCCLKRSFDDGTMQRIRREAEAVAAIMSMTENGQIDLVHSPVHDLENDRNPRGERRLTIRSWLQAAAISVETSPAITARGEALEALGFGVLDALHLAFAECCLGTLVCNHGRSAYEVRLAASRAVAGRSRGAGSSPEGGRT